MNHSSLIRKAGAAPLGTAALAALFIAAVSVHAREAGSIGPPAPSAGLERFQFFEQKIRPVLAEHCYQCHSARAEKLKGGLSLDTRAGWENGGHSGGPAIIPGKPDESPLIQAIRHDDAAPAMPPKKPKLAGAVIADFAAWVKMGAPDPRDRARAEANRADKSWWSLQPLARVEPPWSEGMPEGWRKSPIDRFVFARLTENNLAPSPPAGPRALIRRMTYDVIGLPPSPEEVEAFSRAYAQSPGPAVEALADRLLASPHYGERWGRHWLDVTRFGESIGFERNIINDHIWPFRDYVIRSLNEDKPFNQFIIEHLAGDVIGKNDPAVEVATAFLVAGPYDDVNNQDPAAVAAIRADTLDDIITAAGSAFLGLTINCARCHHHKFDPMPTEDYYRVRAAFEGVEHGLRVVAGKEERDAFAAAAKRLNDQKPRPAAEQEKPLSLPKVWAGKFTQPKTRTFVLKGGDPMKPGAAVAPASLAVLDQITEPYELAPDADEGERRLALARWIASDGNPLTARVLANRVWHYHFGAGIVDTPSDFGFLGGRPSHPELLDWLACRLIAHGWRLKPLHREILLSQAYLQSADFRADAALMDKEARLLWRFPPRRLSAEEIRDTMLSAAGKLDLKMGGPGFRLYEYTRDNVSTYLPLDRHGPETWRRAVYHQNARASVVDLLSVFDLPDSAFAAPARSSTTTPMQALTLLNHSFTLDMAGAFAGRIARESGTDDVPKQIARAFALAFQRGPSPNDLAAAEKLIASHGLDAFCRALLNASELIYLE